MKRKTKCDTKHESPEKKNKKDGTLKAAAATSANKVEIQKHTSKGARTHNLPIPSVSSNEKRKNKSGNTIFKNLYYYYYWI